MSSPWASGAPGILCPGCSRPHFPFCGGREPPVPLLGHGGFPPYAQGRVPLVPLHQQPMAPNVGHLGHLGPRHEGFLEQRGSHGPPMPGLGLEPGLGHPVPSLLGPDRFRPSVGHMAVGGGHMGANNWIIEEERERDRHRQWEWEREREREREREMFLLDQQRRGLVQQHDKFGAQGLGVDRLDFSRPDSESGWGTGKANELGMRGEGHGFRIFRGSHGAPTGHYEKGRENDHLPGMLRGGHLAAVRSEGFEPAQGGFGRTNIPPFGEMGMARTNDGLEFEHNARLINRENDMGMQRPDAYRDFQAAQSEFVQGGRKRVRIDEGEAVQGPREGRFFGAPDMEGTDNMFLGKQNSFHTGTSEYQQNIQSFNHVSGDGGNAFGGEEAKKDDAMSNKRQRPVSREEELLIEHGLLDDSPDRKDNSPYGSELLSNNDTFSHEVRQVFSRRFQTVKGEPTYHGDALDRRDMMRGTTFMEVRDENRDAPLHLHGSQRDLLQGRPVESGSFCPDKPNHWNSVIADDKFGAHGNRATYLPTRDDSHKSIQQSVEVLIPPRGDRVHQTDSDKPGGFEENHYFGGSAIQNFTHLKPQSIDGKQQEESLKTIEELHMDFVQQRQQRMHRQPPIQPAHFQEELFRPNESKSVFPHVHQQHLQSFSQTQMEVRREKSKPYNQDQANYVQIPQMQAAYAGGPNLTEDQIERKTRTGESTTDPYGDRLQYKNIQAQHQWSQPFQHPDSQSERSSMKNDYPSAPMHNYEHFQHPRPHQMVQEHTLQLHEQQQQKMHQPEQEITNLQAIPSQWQQQESQLMPEAPQNFPQCQQNQNFQQQHGSSQLPRQQFQQHLQSQEQHNQSQEHHHHPSHRLIYEKQNAPDRGYQLPQEGNQDIGQEYKIDVQVPHHYQPNQRTDPVVQRMAQFPQQPEHYQPLDGQQQQPQFEQAEQKSQNIFTAGGPLSHINTYGVYEIRSDGNTVPPLIQISAAMPKGQSHIQPPQASLVTPPIPSLPPPPLPPSPPSSPTHAPPPPPPPPPHPPSPPKSSTSACFPSAAAGAHSLPTSMRSFPDIMQPTHGYQYPHAPRHHGAGFPGVGSQGMHQVPLKQFGDQGHCFPSKLTQEDKPKVVDAINIFKQPGRATRPDRFAIILRGLPGSGKSYLAKALRDVEVANGGSAPRIHSMDDYFMTDVEKEEDIDNMTSSLLRSKKRVTKKVLEYCYEPEMEEAYRASMLKAFKKTLEEGIFTFIIVDDRNLRVADFAQFWAVAKRSGYEVYLLEAPYKDPAGCAARNVHGFTAEEVQEMAKCWEPAPPLYLQLDIAALFHSDDLNAQVITEVEMDTDDIEHDVEDQDGESKTDLGTTESPSEFLLQNGVASHGDRWGSENLNARDEAKDLARSKWSDDHEEDKTNVKEIEDVDCNALSGLMQAYGKGDRCVRWADQGGKDSEKGFSIGRLLQNKRSLIIGPGPGYNEASNPLPEEERSSLEHGNSSGGESKRNTKILEQLRAEQETFRAVFDRRRHRIGGMDEDDE